MTGIALGAIALQVLFDPMGLVRDALRVARIRAQLASEQEKWQALGPGSYSLDVRVSLPMSCLFQGRLTVLDGELAKVERFRPSEGGAVELISIAPNEWEGMGCNYSQMTVTGSYTRVQKELDRMGVLGGPMDVAFDPARGFVTWYRYGRSHYGGILGATVSECCTLLEFSNLQPIEAGG